jgi:hypothetical protein
MMHFFSALRHSEKVQDDSRNELILETNRPKSHGRRGLSVYPMTYVGQKTPKVCFLSPDLEFNTLDRFSQMYGDFLLLKP